MSVCVWLPLHSAIGGHFVCCCPPKMRLNTKVATWDELSLPSFFLSLSFSLLLFPFIFLSPFLSPSCCSSVSLSIFGRSATGVFIWRLPWQHTHTHAYSRRHFVANFGVCVCVLSAFRRFWLTLALALAIYSAVCCDFATFCGFSTVVDSQAGIGLRLRGVRGHVCVLPATFSCFSHFRHAR